MKWKAVFVRNKAKETKPFSSVKTIRQFLSLVDFGWQKNALMINLFNKHIFLLHETLIDGLESCGLLMDDCDVFISCLDPHSDGTHSLQRIHWWASDVMLKFSTSVPMKKQTHQHLGWPEGEYIYSKFPFCWELILKLQWNYKLLFSFIFVCLLAYSNT